MHVAFAVSGVPDRSFGGGGNWVSAFLQEFGKRHRTTCIAVSGKHDASVERSEGLARKWEESGVAVRLVPYVGPSGSRSRLGTALAFLRNDSRAILPDCYSAPGTMAVVDELQPDIVVCAAHLACYLCAPVKGVPKVGFLAEGHHLNLATHAEFISDRASRGWWARAVERARIAFLVRRMEKAEVRELRDMDLLLFAGYHYIDWAIRHGLENASFMTTPVAEPEAECRWGGRESGAGPFTILAMGHLHSTSNQSQLPLLIHEVLPAMDKHFAGIDYRLRIVGRNTTLRSDYRRVLESHACVELVGPVAPPDEEFINCDVLFVPVPARTGSRVRIIQGFAFGCPIVAHCANRLGIAELAHGGNVLLGSSGEELAALLRRVHDDPELSCRIAGAGRRVYEASYRPGYAADMLEYFLAETWCRYHGRNAEDWVLE